MRMVFWSRHLECGLGLVWSLFAAKKLTRVVKNTSWNTGSMGPPLRAALVEWDGDGERREGVEAEMEFGRGLGLVDVLYRCAVVLDVPGPSGVVLPQDCGVIWARNDMHGHFIYDTRVWMSGVIHLKVGPLL
uniref:Uncharacterized protein n=1 Tax=Mycena chlorophos TaxID=658473 RepID=A0ABQ0KU58_MYCCL|nr:predicted protein [Mycena chlorophos]